MDFPAVFIIPEFAFRLCMTDKKITKGPLLLRIITLITTLQLVGGYPRVNRQAAHCCPMNGVTTKLLVPASISFYLCN